MSDVEIYRKYWSVLQSDIGRHRALLAGNLIPGSKYDEGICITPIS